VQDVLGPGENDDIGSDGGNNHPTASSLPCHRTGNVILLGKLRTIWFHNKVLTQPQPTAVYTAHSAYYHRDNWWQILRPAYKSTPEFEGEKLPKIFQFTRENI